MSLKAEVNPMSKSYLKYLIRNYRIAVIFFAALFFGLAAVPMISSHDSTSAYSGSLEIMIIEAAALTYVLPVILFAFAHRRRSADLFFALPVSRKQQLISSLVFAFCTIFGIFFISSVILYLPSGSPMSFARVFGINATAALVVAALLLVHSLWYLIANNIFDGIVMIGAWSFLPALVYMIVSAFTDYMVAGQNADALGEICMWLSPVAMGVRNLMTLASWEEADLRLYYDILLALWALIGAVGLWHHFVKRKSERAEQLSDDPLAYPLIINFYAFGILIIIACWLVAGPSFSFITLYLMLLFIYVVAQFVYNRRISLNRKIFITFAALSIIAFSFAEAAFHTRAFGLANHFALDKDTNVRINYNAVVDENDLSREIVYPENDGAYYDVSQAYVSFTIYTSVKEYESNAVLKEMMDRYREDGISFFYARGGNPNFASRLNFMNCSTDYYTYTNYYRYTLSRPVSLEDLKYIDRLPYADVMVQLPDDYDEYSLSQYLAKKGN